MSETTHEAMRNTGEDFAALLEESLGANEDLEGSVIKGIVVAIENDDAVVDVGLKSEGRVALKEFALPGQPAELKVGDTVEVYLERMENRNGEAVLSREKARREESWEKLEEAFEKTERVTGHIFGRVKGGFTVDLSGAVAFLPGSQVDIRPVRDVGPLMNSPQPFQILKMDRVRNSSTPFPRDRFSKVSSRTSPTTVHSSIWAASTVYSMLPTWRGAASDTLPRC
jgi:small subunit ribosomal protein S1